MIQFMHFNLPLIATQFTQFNYSLICQTKLDWQLSYSKQPTDLGLPQEEISMMKNQ